MYSLAGFQSFAVQLPIPAWNSGGTRQSYDSRAFVIAVRLWLTAGISFSYAAEGDWCFSNRPK